MEETKSALRELGLDDNVKDRMIYRNTQRCEMELSELLKELGTCKKDFDSAVKILKEISHLEQDRAENLFRLKSRLNKLGENVEQLSHYATELDVLRSWIDQYRESIVDTEEQVRKRFGVELEQQLKERGLPLTGQYPDLRSAMFTIELDFDRERVIIWYGPKQERLSQCLLSVSEVADHIEKSRKQLGSGLGAEECTIRRHIGHFCESRY